MMVMASVTCLHKIVSRVYSSVGDLTKVADDAIACHNVAPI